MGKLQVIGEFAFGAAVQPGNIFLFNFFKFGGKIKALPVKGFFLKGGGDFQKTAAKAVQGEQKKKKNFHISSRIFIVGQGGLIL
jgi:hypothetical protein